jgi:O-acetyl-ADP-ribose deacetylase (regulator of RNase III)
MKTSVGRTKLEVASGDITRLEVDAVVAPAATDLRMDHGVAAAIKRVGGDAVEREAVLQGPVRVGEAVVTTGHDLTARWVIHTAVSAGYPFADADATGIAAATRASLAAAERARSRSVALPALGAGAGAFPLYQCASLMVTEAVAYLRERPGTSLRHVMFSAYDDATRAAFKNAVAGIGRF